MAILSDIILFFPWEPISGIPSGKATWTSGRIVSRKLPQKERTHHNLGFAYYELEQWDEAKRAFEEALRLNPRYALSMYNLGLVFYKKGFLEEAIDCYKKAIDLDPAFPESFYNLGIAYYQKGAYERPSRVQNIS